MILRFFALAAVSLGLLAPVSWADEVIRIMAANTSSGNLQSYDPGHGNRIFQGLDPDIALVQEMNVTLNGSKNSAATYRQWVNENFGTSFHYHVETGKSIPNGIVSRYPFLATGVWEDTQMPDREYVWARIDIPGDMNLLAISVHLSSGGGSSTRNTQAGNLRTLIQAKKLATDHVVLGGDFNTDSRSESCLSTLSPVVVTSSPWPVDQAGLGGTNASRAKPYDWVAPGSSLAALSTPLVIGSNSFANGLVFDSRVYTPLTAVAPVLAGDSGASGMQHMAVMRAFLIPTNDPPVIAQGDSVSVTLSKNNTPTAFSRSLSATDPENNTLTWSILTQAANGTAGIVAPVTGNSVNLSYQPALNYTGSDSFVVRVSDGQGGTDTITVNLTIQEPPNTAPVITEGSSVAVMLSKNNTPTAFSRSLSATDANGDALSWTILTQASHGTAGITTPASGGSVNLSYQPALNYTGSDSFVVRVSDGRGGTDDITVNLTIQEPPNNAPTITQGASIAVTLSRNNTPQAFAASLAATDSDGDALTWSVTGAAAHGSAGIAPPATGSSVALSYTPENSYTGSDAFTVTVSDGRGGSDSILVNLTIEAPPNSSPVISGAAERSVTISQNGHPLAFQLTLDATDADLDPLAWSISSPASHGSASIQANAGQASISYQPTVNFTGADGFTVQVSDVRGGTDTVTVQVTVEGVSALDAWTYAAFQPLDPEEEATVWGEAADPDQDGYTNLEEFAHGLGPKVADAAPNLLTLTFDEQGHAVLAFKMRMEGTAPALDYSLRLSGNPFASWAPLEPGAYTILGDTDLGNGFTERRIRLESPPSLSRLFYRLVYTRIAAE